VSDAKKQSDLVKIYINPDSPILVPSNLESTYRKFEQLTVQTIHSELQIGDIFVDVGANIGFFSVLAGSIIGNKGKVYAVEASPSVLPILKSNTEQLKNVEIINCAVGNKNGFTEFYLTEDYVNSGIAPNPFNPLHGEKISVPIEKLDTALNRMDSFTGKVDFLKIDVQGDEISVLEGFTETLNKNDNLKLIIEWAPAWMENAGHNGLILPDYLKEIGFDELIVVDDWLVKKLTIDEFRNELAKDKTGKRFCNIFAKKRP
jgi:FkbM family methyltransferase